MGKAPKNVIDEAHEISHKILDALEGHNSQAITLALSQVLGQMTAEYGSDMTIVRRNIDRARQATFAMLKNRQEPS